MLRVLTELSISKKFTGHCLPPSPFDEVQKSMGGHTAYMFVVSLFGENLYDHFNSSVLVLLMAGSSPYIRSLEDVGENLKIGEIRLHG